MFWIISSLALSYLHLLFFILGYILASLYKILFAPDVTMQIVLLLYLFVVHENQRMGLNSLLIQAKFSKITFA